MITITRLRCATLTLLCLLAINSATAQKQDCDVNLIEVALVDVTGLNGQPDFNEAHLCSIGDTVRVEFGTPGIACNPNAILSLNELRMTLFDGFVVTDVIVSGGASGPYQSGMDYSYQEIGGVTSVDFNTGATIEMDQENPVIIDFVLEPNCSVAGVSTATPEYELDYSLPGNIPSQVSGDGVIDLRASVFEPFLNIISSSTSPMAALPGEEVCREVRIINNGQFSFLDTIYFKDLPDFPFSDLTSFTVYPIESSVEGAGIDIFPMFSGLTSIDSIALVLDGATYGGADSLFEVDGGVRLEYCLETKCPATVNNSMLAAWYGCDGDICQQADQLESVVVVFNGIPDLLAERNALIPDDPCVSPLMWEFRVVNDSVAGGALEGLDGEADAQDIQACIFRNECQIFDWSSYIIGIGNFEGTFDDFSSSVTITETQDSICFSGLPDLGVNDTLIFKINLQAPDDSGAPLLCEELVSQDDPVCFDPWIELSYEDRCDSIRHEDQTQPLSSTFPPSEGNPLISFTELEYTEPSYCSPGKIVFQMDNLAGLATPTTVANDIQFYVKKQFCSTFDLINYEYGTTATTGVTTGLVVDDTGLDSFYVVSIPSTLASSETLFFSFEISLDCKDSDACVHPDAECFMPDVKATWENCYNLRWFTGYEFGYKILDYKPEPSNALENFGGGAGPNSLRSSSCSSRNYWYRYQFGGINYDDCRVFLRYKVAQINADGTAGSVMTAADMAAGVGSSTGTTTHSIISGVGGAPDTLVIEVESDFIESCIEDEEILINVQHASQCTSTVESVLYYESYEVIFECDNGSECCSFKRSCYENVKQCRCGGGTPPPICYKYCLENTSADICRITNGCPAPDDTFSDTPDPKNFALPCDTMRLDATAQIIRQSSSPASPACDDIAMMFAKINPGPHLEYCPGTAVFTATNGATTLTNSCAPIPYDVNNDEFDLSTCIDWSTVKDGWSISFTADWKVKEDVPACADGFMMEEIEVEFKGNFVEDGSIANCGNPRTQKTEYFVGDPFLARMEANLDFENGCQVTANVAMFDDCGSGNVFNDYRPGYIIDSIVYNINGADFTYTQGSALLKRKGLNGSIDYIVPDGNVSVDNDNGFNITFVNDGSWPEELGRTNSSDSLFCLFFDLEFTECYAYSTNIQASSKIYYNSCGGCGPKEIESPGGISLNNPPEAILNCLGAPIVQTNSDAVQWNIQVGHTPTANLHWVAFDLPPSVTFDEIIDQNGTDILPDANIDGSLLSIPLGANTLDDLTINAIYTECDTVYVPVYVGWACNDYPDDFITGEYTNGESCNVIQKQLAVVRGGTGIQASFVNQVEGGVDLCAEIPFEVVVKNVGTASHFMQEICIFLPIAGMDILPGSVCFAHPDTVASLANQGSFMTISDDFWIISNPDTIVNGQQSKKMTIDLAGFATSLGVDLELPGSTFPETNDNKYRFKWKVVTSCDYISGSKLFAQASAFDRCDEIIFTTAESSDLVPIKGLNPLDYNRNQVVLLDTMLGACIDNQIITANIVSFPNPIGPNEQVCIVIPTEVTLNDAVPFSPVAWDLSSPIITPVAGGSEYCFSIPEGTPPGVLAFNMDISVEATTECGQLNFATYTKVAADAVCVTTGETCQLQIFTSEIADNGVEVIPSIKLIESKFSFEGNCGESEELEVIGQIAIQNQGADILSGTDVAVTIFEDLNSNDILDAGEAISTGTYSDGIASSQIVFVETTFTSSIQQLCNLKVIAGGEDCACTSDAERVDPSKVELNICGDLPLACEGGQANLLCSSFDPTGLFLTWSSDQDPDLDYVDQATGVFGPAPVGTYIYEVIVDLGDGCKFAGSCAMQVIGELGNFTMSGEPSCPGEITKCTIELDPICAREVNSNTSPTLACNSLFRKLRANQSVGFSYSNNGVTASFSGPNSIDSLDEWIETFNDSILTIYDSIGELVCVQNDFGLEQEAYAIPQIQNNSLVAIQENCSLLPGCALVAIKGFPIAHKIDVIFNTPCGTFSTTITYTSYADLEAQAEAYFNSTVAASIGGVWDLRGNQGGISIISTGNITCLSAESNFIINNQDDFRSINYQYSLDCEVVCNSGSVTHGIQFVDLNGNFIDKPSRFCCSTDSKITFNLRTGITGCGKSTLANSVSSILLSDEQLYENPLNDILLYSWEAEGGDVISQEGNCAYLRWPEEGTYEVCATPLLSPDSGLDCTIPPVCKDHVVRADDLRATVSVDAAETCNEISSVNVTFENADDIAEVSICDEDGNIVYQDGGMGCGGMCTNLLLYDLDCIGAGGNCPPISGTVVAGNSLDVHYQIDVTDDFALMFDSNGSLDATSFPASYINDCDFGIEGFADQEFDAASDGLFEDWIKNGLLANASNLFYNSEDCNPYPTSTTFSECNGMFCTDAVVDNSFFILVMDGILLDDGTVLKETGIVFLPSSNNIQTEISEIFDPGSYTLKVTGLNCGETEEYPFELQEPPSKEVLLSMTCNEASSCAAADGTLDIIGSTNGVIDSIVICNVDGSIETIDYSTRIPPLFDIDTTFADLAVGTYTAKLYTECGEEEMSCDINSAEDELNVSDGVVTPYTDCASDDAEISMTVNSSNPIDSIIWCGPMGAIVKDVGPHAAPYLATTGAGIIWGDWTAKIYTACGNIQEVFSVPTPPPGAAVEIACEGIAPASCLETFGSLDITVTTLPAGSVPDSIVLSTPSGFKLVDDSGSLTASFAPLVPGTYDIMVYVWDACNIQSSQCVVPEPDNELIVSGVEVQDLPCPKLHPDSLTTATINYTVSPNTLPIVRVDWYESNGMTLGNLVQSNANPGATSDTYDIPAEAAGEYCVVVIAGDDGLLSSCPRDTFCFTVNQTVCPPDCALEVAAFDLESMVDCDEGSVYNFDIAYTASGCVVEEGLANGDGIMEVTILDSSSGLFKGLQSSQQPSDTLSCQGVAPGEYQIIVEYIENGSAFCSDTIDLVLTNATEIEYIIEVEVIPTPCDENVGAISVTSIADTDGNTYTLTDFDYVLYDGFTPIATINSPNAPDFTGLMTGLYSVELVDLQGGCVVGMVGAIVPNDDAPGICPNSVIASNNCGPCDGTIIMPDSLGIIYRLQDAMGNIVFPQGAPNDHIFVDVCAGMYQVIAFDLSLEDPSECPAICDVEVPISDQGFMIDLAAIEGSPCELNDGRITVTAINGNCSYNYELYDLTGSLISDAPVPDPSAAVCSDKSDKMIFLGLAPGDYKVVGFATDDEGNPMSCMDMDTITLIDNDIKINLEDVVVEDATCAEEADASFCINEALQAGESIEIWDADMNVIATFANTDPTPYCVENLTAGDYQIRIAAGTGFFACVEIIDVTIEEPEVLECTSAPTDPSDCIEEDGSIVVTPSGGTPEYTIVWDDPAITGFTPTDLSVGIYPFEITDANGCTKRDTVELSLPFCNEPCPDIVEEFAVVDAECGVSNGNIFVTVQGAGTYMYLWDNGATTQELSDLPAGIYCVTITSVSNPECTYETCQEIDEIDGPMVGELVTNATCDEDGELELSITGGTPGYTIAWDGPDANDGGPIPATSPYVITGPNGTYNVTITDANGCENFVFGEIEKDDGLQVTSSATQFPSCTANTGEITINVIGGIFPYDYYINDVLYTTSNAATLVIPDLGPGSYTIRVEDGSECSGENATVLETGGLPMTDPADWIPVPAICSGDNGKIEFTGDGSADIVCKIYAENSTIPLGETTADVSTSFDVPAGTYSVICEDVNTGCSDVLAGIEVTSPEPLDFIVQYAIPVSCEELGHVTIVEITGGYDVAELDITITDENGNVITTAMTTGDVIESGTFTVSVCYTGADDAMACCKTRVVEIDSDLACCAELAGEIFYDLDGNGCQDEGEGLVMEDVTVSLYTCNAVPGTDPPAAVTVVNDGIYAFGEESTDIGADICLDPNEEYFVHFDIPNGAGEALEDYEFTTGTADATCSAAGNSDDVDPLTGESDCYDPEDDDPSDDDDDEHIDVGITPPCEDIAGEIFYDGNENGCQDTGEDLVTEAIDVTLFECGDDPATATPVASTTVTDGSYEFSADSDDPGAQVCLSADTEYFVVFDIPNGAGEALADYEITSGVADPTCEAGGDADDVDPTTAQSECHNPEDDDPDDDDDDNHIDIGITPPCEQLAGEIFYDGNENGCQDAGEGLVMEDVNITLYECGDLPGVDSPVASTTVNDGEYVFGETSNDEGADVCLEAGTQYFVVFTIPNGVGQPLEDHEITTGVADPACEAAGESDDVDPNSGQSGCYDPDNTDGGDGDDDEDIDIGIVPPCEQIAGEIFYDIDANGCQDAGEGLVMEDIDVTLYECGSVPGVDAPVATTTVSDGVYNFGLGSDDPGAAVCLEADTEYFVVFDIPNGAGEALEDHEFTQGVADATCEAAGASDDVDPTTGQSECHDPEDDDPTDDDDDEHIDVGITPPCEDVAGEIFYDGNDNGCQDPGESLVTEAVNVSLYECGDDPATEGPVASTTVTDGMYEFSMETEDEGAQVCLDPDTQYFVVFEIPNGAGEALEGYEFSSMTADPSCEASGDSDDVDPSTGQSECYDPEDDDPTDDDDDNDIDAGITPLCEQLAGEIFYDGNENGCQDAGEGLVMTAIDVTLYECGDDPATATPVASTTVTDGSYVFGETSDDEGADVCLEAGTQYFVVFDIPNGTGQPLSGYEVTTGTADPSCEASGESDDVDPGTSTSGCYDPDNTDGGDGDDDENIDIGIVPPCEQIVGEIFYDNNSNGCQDEDEGLVMEAIDISLFECGQDPETDTPVASTTVTDGVYNFGLASDDEGANVCLEADTEYFVVFDLPIDAGEALEDHSITEGVASPECEVAGESSDIDPGTSTSECYDPENDDPDDDDDDEHIDIGIDPPCYELAGEIYYDLNNNGCQDNGETLVMTNVTISLYECGSLPGTDLPIAATAVVDGDYAFGEESMDPGADICLEPGTDYFVVIDIPNGAGQSLEGYSFSSDVASPVCGDDGNADDVDMTTGMSGCYDPDNDDPTDNDDDEHIDAGIYPCETMGGTVFYDNDSDGCHEPSEGETGVEDVTVYLYACDEANPDPSNALTSVTTDENGDYQFDNTKEGGEICLDPNEEYYVVFDLANAPGEALDGYDFTPGESADCAGNPDSDDVDPQTGQSDCHDPKDDDPDDDDDDEDIDAGISPCETLGGEVFYDYDDNGCQDQVSETGVSGVTVYLYSCNESDPNSQNALASDLTDFNGDYGFGSMEEGSADVCLHPDSSYYVVFDLPNGAGEALQGYDFTSGDSSACDGSPDSDDVDPATGQSDCYDPEDDDPTDDDDDEDIDAGIKLCETIGGTVFYDNDSDGCHEPNDGEAGVEDVTVYLYACDETNPDPINALTSVTTDEDGEYQFDNTEEGGEVCLDPNQEYYVVFDLPNAAGEALEGYDFTPGDSAECAGTPDSDDIDPVTGQSDCYDPEDDDDEDGDDDDDIDVGITPCESVAGEVFYDRDGDGCHDEESESGVAGVTVYIYECGEENPSPTNALGSAVTDSEGAYAFGNDQEGDANICLNPLTNYYVVFDIPNGTGESLENWNFTEGDSAECAGTSDSDDVNPATGQSDCYDPEDDDDEDGDDDEDIDAGISSCEELGGTVFLDANNDGCQSGDAETGIVGVDVYIYECGEENPTPDNALANVTTAEDGSYEFGPDEEGGEICLYPDKEYYVVFDLPNGDDEALEGYEFSSNEECADTPDSDDVDPLTGQSECYDPEDDDDNDGDDDGDVDAGVTYFDLALIKVINTPGPYRTGDLVEFVISVVNQGGITAANITIADHVPSGFSYDASNNGGWDDTDAPTYHYNIPGTLLSGDTAFVSMWLQVEYVDQDPANYTNIAEISNATDEDGDPVTDIDSDPDDDKDNDGDPVDNTYDDKDDEDDHDPEVLPQTGLAPECLPSCDVACIGQLNLSLGESCEASLSPSMLIVGLEDSCDDADFAAFFDITISDQAGNELASNLITSDYVGQLIKYSITVNNDAEDCNNTCWGNILVESKFVPVLDCGEAIDTISCIELPVFDGPPLSGSGTSGCFPAEVTLEILNEQILDVDPCEGDLVKKVIRQYQAVDVSGARSNICTQELHITKLDVSLISIPVSTSINLACNAEIGTIEEEDIAPGVVPYYNPMTGSGIPLYPLNDNFCNIFVEYTDEVILDQPCKKQVLRTWDIRQWHCNKEDVVPVPPQILTLIDEKPPVLVCPSDTIEVSTSGSDCTAKVLLPEISALDSCNLVSQIDMSYAGGFVENQNGGEISDVPVGFSAVTYIAYDACGNSSSCQVHINVLNDSAPVIICEQHTQVSITRTGEAHVPATVFDDGSYDACGKIRIEARRMDLSCQTDPQDSTSLDFGEYVRFCCADVGTTQMVALRVTNKNGRENQCMVEVTVVDKNPPALVAPPDITVSCEFVFDSNDLSVFGRIANSELGRQPIVIVDDSLTIDGSAFDGLVLGACGVDIAEEVDMGNVSSCGTGQITRSFSVSSNGTTVTDEQIIRVISSVAFDPDRIVWPRDTFFVDRCTPLDLDPNNLPVGVDRPMIGEGVCELIGASITNEQIFSADNDGLGCVKLFRTWSVIDWCNTDIQTGLPARWDSIQKIGLENTTAPIITTCVDTAEVYNSFDANCNPVAVSLSAAATDDCTVSSSLLWTWTVDLDGNGSIDTSGFGDSVNAAFSPGTHKIVWLVEDLCGNVSLPCTQYFVITNEKAAPAICLDHVVTDLVLMDTDNDGIVDIEMVEIWASDVVKKDAHPCGHALSYSFDQSGLQDSIIYGCADVGFNSVMVYTTNLTNGTTSSCWTEIEVQDNNGRDLCGELGGGNGERADVSGLILTESGDQISETEVNMLGSELPKTTTNLEGQYAFNNMPMGGDYTVVPTKDINYMNGVSTLDLVLIQKHILGLEILDSPYKMIAGDINRSNSISAADIVQLRKLILGEVDGFDNNQSWRFIDKLHEFESPNNPWTSVVPESYDIFNLSTDMIADFVGVKVGDVTSNAKGDELVTAELRTSSDALTFIGKVEKEGLFKVVEMTAANFTSMYGFQTTISYDVDQYEYVKVDDEQLDISMENVGTRYASKGLLTLSWHSDTPIDAASDEVLFRFYFKPKHIEVQPLKLVSNSKVTMQEAYLADEITDKVDIEMIEESASGMLVLDQNEPNPWRESTLIGFSIPDGGEVQLRLFDNTGKLIHRFADSYGIGDNEITIGRDIITAPGIYLYEIQYKEQVEHKRMVVLN